MEINEASEGGALTSKSWGLLAHRLKFIGFIRYSEPDDSRHKTLPSRSGNRQREGLTIQISA
jgi:hypothetical protein